MVQLGLGGCWGWLDGRGRERKRQFFNDLQAGTANELRDDRVVEAGGVVLDGDGVSAAVEGDAPDSVYLARVGESEADGLGGRRGIAEDNVYGRHEDRIAVVFPRAPVRAVTGP